MAASNRRHRKLPEDPTVVDPYCTRQCNLQLNPAGLCLPTCYFICPSICNIIIESSSPPPSLSPATTPFPSLLVTEHHHHPPLSLPLRISLIFLFVTFSLFFLYTLCKFYAVWYRSRRRRLPPSVSEDLSSGTDGNDLVVDHPIWHIMTTGLQASVIDAIAVVRFSIDGGVVEGSDCSVCLSEFEADQTLRLLPNCKHAFHVSCIDTWLRSHTNCPLCRAGIVDNFTVGSPTRERSVGEVVVIGEIVLGISVAGDGYGGGEASESSELRTNGEDVSDIAKAEVLINRRSDSLDDLEFSDDHEIPIEGVDEDLGMETDQTIDENHPKRDGK